MSLPHHLFTPAFRQQHLGRSFAAIVGIMVFIATFAMAAEAVLLGLGYDWGRTMESRMTVEIPAVGDEAAQPQAERVRQAVSVLRGLPDIGLVMPLSDNEVIQLLRPWFTQPELLKALPLPTLIDVERKPESQLSSAQIQESLKNVVRDARVDDHGAWTQDIWRLVRGLSIVGLLTIGMTGVTLVIAVSLICRAVMAAEGETITLLHFIGAPDRDIARHFQQQAQRISGRAAFGGFACAATATAALMFVTRHIADFSDFHAGNWVLLGLAAIAVPMAAVFIATLTARLSVLRLIKGMP